MDWSHLPSVAVAGVDVPVQTNSVRYPGVMFNFGMTMSPQVANIINKMLTTEAATQLVSINYS